jgi:hypothetical protein
MCRSELVYLVVDLSVERANDRHRHRDVYEHRSAGPGSQTPVQAFV